MQGQAKSTLDYSLSFDQLRENFPRTAGCFRASAFWNPHKEMNILADLVTFLDLQDFVIINAMVYDFDDVKNSGPIGYEPVVLIKGCRLDLGGRWFPDFDHARLYALDYALDIFEVEQKIRA